MSDTNGAKLDIKRLAAIAEIISSVAIVVTLVYLTIETRQNTDALLANSRQTALSADLALLENSVNYPELGEVMFGLSPGLSDTDVRVRAHIISFLRVREFLWSQYEAGLMDEAAWQSYMRPLESVLSTPAARAILDQYRGNPAFIAYVEEFLDESTNAPQD